MKLLEIAKAHPQSCSKLREVAVVFIEQLNSKSGSSLSSDGEASVKVDVGKSSVGLVVLLVSCVFRFWLVCVA